MWRGGDGGRGRGEEKGRGLGQNILSLSSTLFYISYFFIITLGKNSVNLHSEC